MTTDRTVEAIREFDAIAERARVGMGTHGVCVCRQCEAWSLQEVYYRDLAAKLREEG